MPELIDRHALLKNVYDNPPEKARMTQGEWCRKCIYKAPTIEAEPVRHGRWLPCLMLKFKYECGCCGEPSNYPPPYCPNCGADMREEGTDNRYAYPDAVKLWNRRADNG